jgi:uncharacterized repeat protein (TIGR02543 family)
MDNNYNYNNVNTNNGMNNTNYEVPNNNVNYNMEPAANNKKGGKGIIIVVILLLVIIGVVVSVFLLKGKDKEKDNSNSNSDSNINVVYVTVIFEANGGDPVPSLKVEKGKTAELPTPVREGYTFDGWYLEDNKVSSDATYDKDTVLKAKWTKDETSNSNSNSNSDSNSNSNSNSNENKVEYTCPSGYTLNGTKCIMVGKASTVCPTGTKADGNLCIKVTDYNQGTRTCKKESIDGHEYNGEKFDAGTTFCAYAVLTAYKDRNACTAAGYSWASGLGKCYKKVVTGNFETTCANGYQYYSSADMQNKFGSHNNGGCYKKVDKETTCESGFTLTNGKCTKTIDATKK